jgi:hypothetical protein
MTASNDIEDRIRDISQKADDAERILGPILPRLGHVPISPAAVRSHVTRLVVWAFVIYAAAIGLFIMFAPSTDRFAPLLELLKTFFVPVVTFVIGHYFGSKSE